MWTWIRTAVVSAALLAAFATPCAAQSLHLAPTGTVVSGSFELAGKAIPLPEGEFLLAAMRIDLAADPFQPRGRFRFGFP